GLMQAIARVNRVYKDKPGGLIVDYIGIAENLKKALAMYDSDIQKNALLPLDEIIREMNHIHSDAIGFLHGVSFKGWRDLKGIELSNLLQECMNEVISKDERLSDDQKMKYIGTVNRLSKLHALVMPSQAGMDIVTDVQFLQAIKEGINKQTVVPKAVFPEETESAIRSLIHDSIQAEGIIDLFAKDGQSKSISVFDAKFVEEIKKVRFQNFAVDAVRKLLDQEIISRMRMNKARYETMLILLTDLIEKYENNVISSAEIIKRLLEIADEIKKLDEEVKVLGLSYDEISFYDTLVADPYLKNTDVDIKEFTKELVRRIRRDLVIDWANNETIKARIRQNVRLLLLQNGILDQKESVHIIESIYLQVSKVYQDYMPAK
ncbi:MAG: type I restriction enzyme endonuclease domain-containing protein, partial [Patescibacteria group bacterium]